MSKEFLIYMHVAPNGKAYIGQTKNLKKRNNHHQATTGCNIFAKAIKKYGWDSFSHHILADGLTIDEANSLEVQLIAKYKTQSPNGYNLRSGGGNGTHSQETIERMRESSRGRVISDETKIKISQAKLGKKQTPEHIAKSSASRIGRITSYETKQKISNSLKGRAHSDERKQNISLGKSNPSDETRKKLSDSAKGRTASEETKKKMSESQRAIMNKKIANGTTKHSDETKIKMSKAKLGKKQSPELITKRIAASMEGKRKKKAAREAASKSETPTQ